MLDRTRRRQRRSTLPSGWRAPSKTVGAEIRRCTPCRAMVARGLLDRALAINDLLPSFGWHHAWVAMDVAIRRASDGDMSAAIATVTGEIASLRRSSRPRPVREEATLAGLLI